LCRYYLECLSPDDEAGLRVFARSRATKEIVGVLTLNLVTFHAWIVTLGETDQAAWDVVLRHCRPL
jgi:hypothetical protein